MGDAIAGLKARIGRRLSQAKLQANMLEDVERLVARAKAEGVAHKLTHGGGARIYLMLDLASIHPPVSRLDEEDVEKSAVRHFGLAVGAVPKGD